MPDVIAMAQRGGAPKPGDYVVCGARHAGWIVDREAVPVKDSRLPRIRYRLSSGKSFERPWVWGAEMTWDQRGWWTGRIAGWG